MQTEETFKESLFSEQQYLGAVTEVFSSSVTVVLPYASANGAEPGDQGLSGEVGGFILVESANYGIIGQISSIRVPDPSSHSEQEESDWAYYPRGSVQLLATVDFNTGKITQGVYRPPLVGSKVFHADASLVQALIEAKHHGESKRVSLSFARFMDAAGMPLTFTPEMVFGRHCAILGATGGGKSWTLARMIEEVARYKSKVILFDASGEYWRLNCHVRHLYIGKDPEPKPGSRPVSVPYYHLTESDLFAIFKPSGQSQGPKLRAAMKSLKLAILSPSLALDGVIVKADKEKLHYDAEFQRHIQALEIPEAVFDITKLARQIENECVKPTRSAFEPNFWGGINGIDQAYCMPLVTKIQDLINSEELQPIFRPSETPSLLDEVKKFLDDPNTRVLRISLAYLPFAHNAREIIANAIGRQLLHLARHDRFKKNPLLVVVDEAHQFLKQSLDGEERHFPLDAFGMIAKEGRKYCLSICLATQRPRDIPESVLSQMGTLVVHRLINDADRSVVERASAEVDRSAIELLPTLAPGQAVVLGVDFPIPITVQVEAPEAEPESKGPDFQQYWK